MNWRVTRDLAPIANSGLAIVMAKPPPCANHTEGGTRHPGRPRHALQHDTSRRGVQRAYPQDHSCGRPGYELTAEGDAMTRFVIGPDVALHLAQLQAAVPAMHQLLAPTLIRCQVLAQLYSLVRRGELDRKAAERQLDHLRGLRLRLLGDRVLQSLAWKIADQLSWPDTFVAEYIVLTQLQVDAFFGDDEGHRCAIGVSTAAGAA